ncbi:ribose-5-phosphate isomerase RpiA [uncultured Sphingomonas sp.]|uniref:ribose-5-phosphate isomerase RpiA n=1 Tax=uncultured Sphingomonas sp. TaxID=158754 RepID=UPI0035CC0006
MDDPQGPDGGGRGVGLVSQDADKHAAAAAAVAEVRDGMIVGLGTGSTAAHAIRLLGERVRDQGLRIRGVATSTESEVLARQWQIPHHDLRFDGRVDLAIDGADEIDDRLFAIKGAGGAMLREKVVASAADRMIAIIDGTKRVTRIGAARVPVEYWSAARGFVERALGALGADPVRRMKQDGDPYRTDLGNDVFDCGFAGIDDPAALDRALSAIPGVFGHGLFLTQIDVAYIATGGVVTKMEREPPSGVA